MVEHQLCKLGVIGSIPIISTIFRWYIYDSFNFCNALSLYKRDISFFDNTGLSKKGESSINIAIL